MPGSHNRVILKSQLLSFKTCIDTVQISISSMPCKTFADFKHSLCLLACICLIFVDVCTQRSSMCFRGSMLYVSGWDKARGVWCDIYVGVIVWSVKTFHNRTHSLPCGAVEARLCVNYNMCEMLLHAVPHLKHEAKDNFDWIPLFVFCILSWEAENACLWKVHWSICMSAVKLAAVLTFETGWSGPLRPTPLPTVRPICTFFFFLKH